MKTTIGLNNVTTQHTRAEDITNRKFDFVVSRAVAPLKDLWKWSNPLLKSGKYMQEISEGMIAEIKSGLICLKGGDLASEISESGIKPKMMEISHLFDEEFFEEKTIEPRRD